jgi:NAD(P)-dependent dehydrogenase (short-subunit alcohol dehydrogenase family)
MTESNQIVLVTGANKGIGHEVARQLALRGMIALVGARDRTRGERAVESICAAGGNAQLVVLDVTDRDSIAAAARDVEARFGHLDVLVNNAAIATGSAEPSQQSVEAMRAIYETNVFGVVAVTQAFLPLLRRARAARIVNVSSSLGSLGLASDPTTPSAQQNVFFAYASSKTVLNAFTIRLAHELRETPIKVSAAWPGYVATDLNQHQGHRTVEQGAKIIVQLAMLPDDAPTGIFAADGGPVPW